MNKNQALAAMDAHMVRVSAEHFRLLEKRQRYMLWLYPVLKRAPADERIGLFHDARRHAFRQWTVYAALGSVIAAAFLLLRDQIFGGSNDVPDLTVLILTVLGVAPGCALFLHIRSYLRLAIGALYQHSPESPVDRERPGR